MTDITNTSKQSASVHLAGSLIEGSSNYIENMESRGQQELINSTRLPAEARGATWDSDGWAELAALGFVKGDLVEGDELFVEATLPEGWTRAADDHAMWSYILDERGVRRVAVFYKAAFYDRRASMSVMHTGTEVATQVVYGDGELELPAFWPLLTAEERKEVTDYIADYRTRAAEYPDIYGGRLPRVDAFEALIAAN